MDADEMLAEVIQFSEEMGEKAKARMAELNADGMAATKEEFYKAVQIMNDMNRLLGSALWLESL